MLFTRQAETGKERTMSTKPVQKKTRKLGTLKVKSVAADKTTRVKGGPSMGPWKKGSLTAQS
jgi:hypothetical protein